MSKHADLALVLAGGEPVNVDPAELPDGAFVIAADSGLAQAAVLGLAVDLVVGDLDSATPDDIARARAGGACVEQHPTAKDATDLELAMHAAVRSGARRVILLGGEGGRVDHLLGNALLLASPEWAGLMLEWWVDGACLVPIHGSAEFSGMPGDLLTLLAIGEPAAGITTEGLRYPLDREQLFPGSTRGVSNEFTGRTARVTVESGVLVAVLPRRRPGLLTR